MEVEKLTLTIAETAKILGISKGKAYSEAKLGHLPTIVFGRRIVVSRYGLEQMLKEASPSSKPNNNPLGIRV